jgi:hypothetical protein
VHATGDKGQGTDNTGLGGSELRLGSEFHHFYLSQLDWRLCRSDYGCGLGLWVGKWTEIGKWESTRTRIERSQNRTLGAVAPTQIGSCHLRRRAHLIDHADRREEETADDELEAVDGRKDVFEVEAGSRVGGGD